MTDDVTPPPPPPPPPPLVAFESPPPPPPPPSAFGPAYVPELPPVPVQKRGLGMRALAAGLGVVLIGGGLAFAVSQSGSGGATTPEEAVQQLFDAVSDEDIIGVLEVLPDGERRSFQQPLEDLSSELQRLGVLSDGFDLSDVGGVDLQFDDLDLSSEPLATGVSVVHLRGGSLTTAINPDELPLGDELLDLIGELNGEPVEIEPSSNIETLDPTDDAIDIITIEEDGSWRVSLWYSVAEAARSSSDLPLPDFGNGVTPNGQDTPEAAVEAMIRAGIEALDLEAMIALLPPDEMAALYDYAPLFLDDAAAEIDELATDYTGSLTSIELSADRDGDSALVTIDDLEVDVAYDDGETSMSFDGECVRFEDEYSDEEICTDGYALSADGLDELDVPLRDDPPAYGVTTVQVDGRWYVSPTRSLLDSLVSTLGAFDDDALDSLPDLLDGLFSDVLGVVECETFTEVGSVVPDVETPEDPDSFEECTDGEGYELEYTPDELEPEDMTTTTMTSGPSDTTGPIASPTLGGLIAIFVDDFGFPAEEATCIAEGVYGGGFTDAQLLELERGGYPREVAEELDAISGACYEVLEGSTSPAG